MYGSSIHHKCVAGPRSSNSENELSHQALRMPKTLKERIFQIDNTSIKPLKDVIDILIIAGYNVSKDMFLCQESHPFLLRLKEDNIFLEDLLRKMKQPVSLLAQCRRIIVGAVGNPCWDKIALLQQAGVPSLIVNYLHFCDL